MKIGERNTNNGGHRPERTRSVTVKQALAWEVDCINASGIAHLQNLKFPKQTAFPKWKSGAEILSEEDLLPLECPNPIRGAMIRIGDAEDNVDGCGPNISR